jgi:hypothetical protein
LLRPKRLIHSFAVRLASELRIFSSKTARSQREKPTGQRQQKDTAQGVLETVGGLRQGTAALRFPLTITLSFLMDACNR